jgi:hypothetical protein
VAATLAAVAATLAVTQPESRSLEIVPTTRPNIFKKFTTFFTSIFGQKQQGGNKKVTTISNKFIKHVEESHPRIMKKMNETNQLSDATTKFLYKSFLKKNPTMVARIEKLENEMKGMNVN